MAGESERPAFMGSCRNGKGNSHGAIARGAFDGSSEDYPICKSRSQAETYERSTDADGGALFNVGSLTIVTSTFSGNGGPGAYGGAVRNDGVLSVEQSTFSGNRADLGGAIYNVGTLILNHSTLSGNIAVEDGGGIDSGGTLIARNTIFAGNTVDTGLGLDLYGVLTSLGHNLIGNARGGSGFVSSDLLNVNPLLGPLQNNGGPTQTMALLPGSPAIAAGDPTDAPEYDQRGPGFPRLVDGQIDIGAFEVQPVPARRLQGSARPEVPTGSPLDVTGTALDAYGYHSRLLFPSSGDAGVRVGGFTPVIVAEQRLTATNTANPTISGKDLLAVDPGFDAPPGLQASQDRLSVD